MSDRAAGGVVLYPVTALRTLQATARTAPPFRRLDLQVKLHYSLKGDSNGNRRIVIA